MPKPPPIPALAPTFGELVEWVRALDAADEAVRAFVRGRRDAWDRDAQDELDRLRGRYLAAEARLREHLGQAA
jgi:uncharacterized membrane protein YjdF